MTSVLYLIFNRPDLVAKSFGRIREAKPARLFIAADGPRFDHDGEVAKCKETRSIVEHVDWPCEVKILFRDHNLGCKEAVSSAITWFFEHVEEGIILEDDCVADLAFFRFCDELLDLYRNDERVMAISGDNFQSSEFALDYSYYFSIYPHCWGWATWKRAWSLYDGEISNWNYLRQSKWLNNWLLRKEVAEYWSKIFDSVRMGFDSWAYPWTFSCWSNHGLTILPANNLVENIGFDERATHTKNKFQSENKAKAISFPLKCPFYVIRDYQADAFTESLHLGIKKKSRLLSRFVWRYRWLKKLSNKIKTKGI